MRLGSKRKRRFNAPGLDLDIVAVVVTRGHRVVAEIGDGQHDILELLLDAGQFFIEFLDPVVGRLHLFNERLSLPVLAVFLQPGDLPGDRVPPVFQAFDVAQGRQSAGVQFHEAVERLGVCSALCGFGLDQIDVLADES